MLPEVGSVRDSTFRIVVFNEAKSLLQAAPFRSPGMRRRLRDASLASARRLVDWIGGAGQWLYSLAYRAGQRFIDVVVWLYSLAYRAGERVRDVAHGFTVWIWNAMLALLAFFAQCTPAPARFVMHGLKVWAAPGRFLSDRRAA